MRWKKWNLHPLEYKLGDYGTVTQRLDGRWMWCSISGNGLVFCGYLGNGYSLDEAKQAVCDHLKHVGIKVK